MLNLLEIFSILIIHWIADAVFQARNIAINKSESNYVLFKHVLLYSMIWMIFVILGYGFIGFNKTIFLFPIVTFVFHFITDYYTSRLNKKLWLKNDTSNKIPTFNFFTAVLFDQLLHYFQLFICYLILR